MKSNFQHIGLARLCGWFGITRQAYYQNNWEGVSTTIEEELVIQQVKSIRKKHRRMGTRKLHEMVQPFMLEHNIKMGRDALFNMLSANHFTFFLTIMLLHLQSYFTGLRVTTVINLMKKVTGQMCSTHLSQL